MAAILAAIDITGVATAVTAILVGMVGIGVLFMGYRFAKKITG